MGYIDFFTRLCILLVKSRKTHYNLVAPFKLCTRPLLFLFTFLWGDCNKLCFAHMPYRLCIIIIIECFSAAIFSFVQVALAYSGIIAHATSVVAEFIFTFQIWAVMFTSLDFAFVCQFSKQMPLKIGEHSIFFFNLKLHVWAKETSMIVIIIDIVHTKANKFDRCRMTS